MSVRTYLKVVYDEIVCDFVSTSGRDFKKIVSQDQLVVVAASLNGTCRATMAIAVWSSCLVARGVFSHLRRSEMHARLR